MLLKGRNNFALKVGKAIDSMKQNFYSMESFKIEVRNKTYTVEPIDFGNEMQFRISTDCNYLMTLYVDQNENWAANTDVAVMDENLISEIGHAIEFK